MRSFVMSHIIHHRGQLSVYLRLLDMPLPSVYGPTADENKCKKDVRLRITVKIRGVSPKIQWNY